MRVQSFFPIIHHFSLSLSLTDDLMTGADPSLYPSLSLSVSLSLSLFTIKKREKERKRGGGGGEWRRKAEKRREEMKRGGKILVSLRIL
jgi:hypothetical protein